MPVNAAIAQNPQRASPSISRRGERNTRTLDRIEDFCREDLGADVPTTFISSASSITSSITLLEYSNTNRINV